MHEAVVVENAAQVERSADEQKEITQLKKNLYEELSNEKTHGDALETCRVKIGIFLNDVQDKKIWKDWGFESYGSFLDSIAPMVHKGRTSLYNYASMAKELLPYISPEELPEVGITKGRALASAVKKAGKRPSDTLLNAAKSPAISVQEMTQLIQDNFGARDEFEKGTWFSLAGVFFSPEEKEEFLRTVKLASKIDPVLAYTITDWQDASAPQRKEILWRLCAEFLSTHEDTEIFNG